MDGYSISEVAERTGFAPSALRFYEQTGLVSPTRTPAGYRTYDDHHIELLQFVGRAKGFGLSLEEITELLTLLDEDRCEPVQERLRGLVETKIADAQFRAAELVAFTAELRHVADSLSLHTPHGPCDDTCGCTSTSTGDAEAAVPLIASPSGRSDPTIACTLNPADTDQRLADWLAIVRAADATEPIEGGLRLRFSPETDVGTVASLAAAEHGCCPFFTFTITIGAATTLDITGAPENVPLLEALMAGRA